MSLVDESILDFLSEKSVNAILEFTFTVTAKESESSDVDIRIYEARFVELDAYRILKDGNIYVVIFVETMVFAAFLTRSLADEFVDIVRGSEAPGLYRGKTVLEVIDMT